MLERIAERLCIEVGNTCDIHCLHCLRNVGKAEWFDLELFENLLTQATAFGPIKVVLTGGETTIHPEIERFFVVARSFGVPIQIVTNGHTFGQFYHKLCVAEAQDTLEIVTFSLDGATGATHNAIRGKGSFKKVIAATALCRVKAIPFRLQLIVNAINAAELEAFALLGRQLGATAVSFGWMQPTHTTVRKQINLSVAQWTDVRERLHRLVEAVTIPVELSIGFNRYPFLFRDRFLQLLDINVDYLGRCTFCCQLSNYGDDDDGSVICDLRETSLIDAQILRNRKVFELMDAKLRHLKENNVGEKDLFPCWYCIKHFGKADSCAHYQDDPWFGDGGAGSDDSR